MDKRSFSVFGSAGKFVSAISRTNRLQDGSEENEMAKAKIISCRVV